MRTARQNKVGAQADHPFHILLMQFSFESKRVGKLLTKSPKTSGRATFFPEAGTRDRPADGIALFLKIRNGLQHRLLCCLIAECCPRLPTQFEQTGFGFNPWEPFIN